MKPLRFLILLTLVVKLTDGTEEVFDGKHKIYPVIQTSRDVRANVTPEQRQRAGLAGLKLHRGQNYVEQYIKRELPQYFVEDASGYVVRIYNQDEVSDWVMS